MEDITRSLRSLWAVFKQEFSIYFASPIVYLMGAIWLLFAGGFFSLSLWGMNQQGLEPAMTGMLQPMVFLMLFIGPALTMRLLSEEIRQGTHELLFTSPVRDWEIVVGKWLGAWAVMSTFMLVTFAFPFILTQRGNPEMGLIITGYLGLWLMSGAVLAIGIFASALTQYQLVAFMIGLGVVLGLYLSELVARIFSTPPMSEVFTELSLLQHYDALIQRAVINPMDIAYFAGVILIFLFLATQILSTRRWSA